jgi:hypothetical protein
MKRCIVTESCKGCDNVDSSSWGLVCMSLSGCVRQEIKIQDDTENRKKKDGCRK